MPDLAIGDRVEVARGEPEALQGRITHLTHLGRERIPAAVIIGEDGRRFVVALARLRLLD